MCLLEDLLGLFEIVERRFTTDRPPDDLRLNQSARRSTVVRTRKHAHPTNQLERYQDVVDGEHGERCTQASLLGRPAALVLFVDDGHMAVVADRDRVAVEGDCFHHRNVSCHLSLPRVAFR